ncbi:hypothetical protein [Anatilimnocola aggregata]|uniref:hypothetical protein n=1 Tax=Anatilimnocola aggregata TaxID=2528021 RepID=UPI0011A03785|nr:hypothetical protein [Anatilimnocola aggregata]
MLKSCLLAICLSASVVLFAGCNASGIYPVSGTVKFADGEMPNAEVATIVFKPIVEETTNTAPTKPASGRFGTDGTFQLTTLNPNDGAYAGEYKVIFSMRKEYMGTDSLIDGKFTSVATTPYTVKVEAGGKNKFDFELTRATGK